ncbi:hypothetical protein SO802_011401 [Lithocarpus litseifolius]|uniref:Uncharacterized protein n=1 Tax=Lithocarpus litseifolius TaxID=425828 RepID=A0AAW2CZV7_9ROSI
MLWSEIIFWRRHSPRLVTDLKDFKVNDEETGMILKSGLSKNALEELSSENVLMIAYPTFAISSGWPCLKRTSLSWQLVVNGILLMVLTHLLMIPLQFIQSIGLCCLMFVVEDV